VVPSMIAPILAFVLVVNRVYWRFKMVGRLGPDDYSTILALVIRWSKPLMYKLTIFRRSSSRNVVRLLPQSTMDMADRLRP
jgi:hypothetical protein